MIHSNNWHVVIDSKREYTLEDFSILRLNTPGHAAILRPYRYTILDNGEGRLDFDVFNQTENLKHFGSMMLMNFIPDELSAMLLAATPNEINKATLIYSNNEILEMRWDVNIIKPAVGFLDVSPYYVFRKPVVISIPNLTQYMKEHVE